MRMRVGTLVHCALFLLLANKLAVKYLDLPKGAAIGAAAIVGVGFVVALSLTWWGQRRAARGASERP